MWEYFGVSWDKVSGLSLDHTVRLNRDWTWEIVHGLLSSLLSVSGTNWNFFDHRRFKCWFLDWITSICLANKTGRHLLINDLLSAVVKLWFWLSSLLRSVQIDYVQIAVVVCAWANLILGRDALPDRVDLVRSSFGRSFWGTTFIDRLCFLAATCIQRSNCFFVSAKIEKTNVSVWIFSVI